MIVCANMCYSTNGYFLNNKTDLKFNSIQSVKNVLIWIRKYFNPHKAEVNRIISGHSVSMAMRTQNSESQQQVVGVAAAVAGIFVRNLCIVISQVFFFLLFLFCVGLVGCRLICHPACGDIWRDGFTSGRLHALT